MIRREVNIKFGVPKPMPLTVKPLDTISPLSKTIIINIQQYMKDMNPNNYVSREDGARNQLKLFRSLKSFINLENNKDFQDTLNLIVYTFELNKDSCLRGEYIYRFLDVIDKKILSDAELDGFTALVDLIMFVIVPEDRVSHGHRVDLDRLNVLFDNEVTKTRFFRVFENILKTQ